MKKRSAIKTRTLLILILVAMLLVIVIVPKEIFKDPSSIGKVIASVNVIGGQFPPFFDPDLVNQTVNQSEGLYYDINCSDLEVSDVLSYYDNSTLFDIDNETGIINVSFFYQNETGNHTINITCSDGRQNTSQTFILEVLDDNGAPILDEIDNQLLTSGVLFELDIDATDIDNDTLTFGSNSTIFTINPVTGVINFTPTDPMIGNHTINITVFDGQLYDYDVVIFTIVSGSFCGDTFCGIDESCVTCAVDCGQCPPPPPVGEGDDSDESDAGGGGGGGAIILDPELSGQQEPFLRCDEKWECGEWNECGTDEVQTRTCIEVNECGTKNSQPAEVQPCEYEPTCFDGIKNGDEEGVDCGGSCEPCFVPTCDDGLQNQGESGIDCGGPCDPCEIEEITQVPFLEVPGIVRIPRFFPWLLLIIILIIDTLCFIYDQIKMHRIKKKPFREYRKALRDYRPVRRRLYKFMLNTTIITPILFFYIYYFSNDIDGMIRFAWIPTIIILLVPIGVSAFVRNMQYRDYIIMKKQLMLKETHKRELLQLVGIENKLLLGLEAKARKMIYNFALKRKFNKSPEFYYGVGPIFSNLSRLRRFRKKRIELSRLNSEVFDLMNELLMMEKIREDAKTYPEFMSILENMLYIVDHINIETHDKEEDLLFDIREVSRPHLLAVIQSDPQRVWVYNALVDIFNNISDKHKALEKDDSDISLKERKISEEIQDITKKPVVMSKVGTDVNFSKLYNRLIELFNHYLKKQELSARLKEL